MLKIQRTDKSLFSQQAFGGAYDDVINGDAGEDIILGDFGYYDAQNAITPFVHHFSNVDNAQYAGFDIIHGGDGDDFLMGQEVCKFCPK